MIRTRWLILVFALGGASAALGQQPGVELIVPSTTLEVGEVIDVQLVCTNTDEPSPPQAVVPEGLTLKLANPIPSTQTFTQIINGRRSGRTTYTFAMRLAALRAGTYTLGPLSVTAGGRTYQAQPVTIRVRQPAEDVRPRGDRYLFATIEVSTDSLYLTQSLTATLTFGIRTVVMGGRTIDVDMLRSVLDLGASQLSVFEGGQASRSRVSLTDSSGERHGYEVYRVSKEIRADQVGELRIGPVFLKANYPTSLRRGFFGRYETSRSRKETARADAITVRVKAPPLSGRPDDFTGAIGRYDMSVSVKPTRIEQGQPCTLEIALSGSPLEGVAGPDLTRQAELTSRFDFTPDELVGDLEGGRKVFRRAIFPKQVGRQTVPPIAWSYFDPQREQYVTLTSRAVEITVTPSSKSTSTLLMPVETEPQSHKTKLRVLTGGISPNYVDTHELLANHALHWTPLWMGSVAAAPLVWLIVFTVTAHRRRLESDVSWARRRGAKRRAHARLHRAMRNGNPSRQWHDLSAAAVGYLADRFNLPGETLTPAEVRNLFEQRRIDETLRSEFISFLETCDTMRYAPGSANDLSPAAAAKKIRGWIKQLEGRAS